MNSKQLRAARREKLMRRFAAGSVSEPILATGNHLSAANDEPELFTEEQLLEIDRAYEAGKSSGALAEHEYRRALDLQIDANRRDPMCRGIY